MGAEATAWKLKFRSLDVQVVAASTLEQNGEWYCIESAVTHTSQRRAQRCGNAHSTHATRHETSELLEWPGPVSWAPFRSPVDYHVTRALNGTSRFLVKPLVLHCFNAVGKLPLHVTHHEVNNGLFGVEFRPDRESNICIEKETREWQFLTTWKRFTHRYGWHAFACLPNQMFDSLAHTVREVFGIRYLFRSYKKRMWPFVRCVKNRRNPLREPYSFVIILTLCEDAIAGLGAPICKLNQCRASPHNIFAW